MALYGSNFGYYKKIPLWYFLVILKIFELVGGEQIVIGKLN
jgi:hypothetical protein